MCDLSDLYEDGDVPSVWREQRRKARKGHTCSICLTPIRPGDWYTNHFSVYDCGTFTEILCTSCGEDRDKFMKEHGGGMLGPTTYFEVLQGCISEDEESKDRWEPVLDSIIERRAASRAVKEEIR